MKRIFALCLGFFLGPVWATDCPWLPLAKVEAALAHLSPWQADPENGPGRCRFVSRAKVGPSRNLPELLFALQIHPSSKDAEEMAQVMQEQTAEYKIERVAALGAHGVKLTKLGELRIQNAVSWSAQRDKMTLFVTWIDENKAPVAAESKAVEGLVLQAMQNANGASIKEAASRCPYWDEAVLKKLLPGQAFRIQQFTAGLCVGSDGTGANASLSVDATAGPESTLETLVGLRSEFCRNTLIGEFGPGASLEHDCKVPGVDSTSIVLNMPMGNRIARLSFTAASGKEPSAAQRALLLQLGRSLQVP